MFQLLWVTTSDFAEKRRKGPKEESKDEGDKPTEETVERMEEKLESAQSDQKNLFLIIFQVLFLFSYYLIYSLTRI